MIIYLACYKNVQILFGYAVGISTSIFNFGMIWAPLTDPVRYMYIVQRFIASDHQMIVPTEVFIPELYQLSILCLRK